MAENKQASSLAKFHRIGIGINSESSEVVETCKQLVSVLQKAKKEFKFIEQTPPGSQVPSIAAEKIAEHCDLVIVVGGDGSFLKFAKKAAMQKLPLLGINCGRVGFLTDLAHDDITEELPDILNGDYLEDEHILLEGTLHRDGKEIGRRLAFNDLVIHSGSGRVMELDLFVQDRFAYREHSDGIIVATPHGSTAYALSAGGPIIVPPARVIALVNISPQTLTNRPLLLPYTLPVSVRILAGKDITFYADGWEDMKIKANDSVNIRVSKQTVRLVHPRHYDFYTACRNKLDWQTRT